MLIKSIDADEEDFPFQLLLISADSADQAEYVNVIFRSGTIVIRLLHARGIHGLPRVRPPQP